MRRLVIAFTVGLVCWPGCGTGQAGLYLPAEKVVGPNAGEAGVKPMSLDDFRIRMGQLLLCRSEKQSEPPASDQLRPEYLKRRDALETKLRAGTITVEERVNLSGYLINLGKYDAAAECLAPVAGRDQRNFMVFANLATANQLAGGLDRLERAVAYLIQAKDVWPKEWPGLSATQLVWYRQVETYHLRLLRLRKRELGHALPGAPKQPEQVDALFGPDAEPLRFVGESGSFEAGKMAESERSKIPRDGVAIIQQLLLWMPDDSQSARIYWLLGELLNAQGDVEGALAVFNECVDSRRLRASELVEHRRILLEAMPAPATTPKPGFVITTQMWIVGGVTGVVLAVLAYLQFQEFRRRRLRSQGNHSASEP